MVDYSLDEDALNKKYSLYCELYTLWLCSGTYAGLPIWKHMKWSMTV